MIRTVPKIFAWAILENPLIHEWSLQGMGMLRLFLPNNSRLHIWDSRYRAPNVSMIHDHLQWGLTSSILAGSLVNRIYKEVEPPEGQLYNHVLLKPGYGTHFKEEPSLIRLAPLSLTPIMKGRAMCRPLLKSMRQTLKMALSL